MKSRRPRQPPSSHPGWQGQGHAGSPARPPCCPPPRSYWCARGGAWTTRSLAPTTTPPTCTATTPSPAPRHVSCVMCHVSCVMCPVSCTTCHVSLCHYVSLLPCHVSIEKKRCQASHITCHMSCVMCHFSRFTCCMSPGTCQMSLTPTATATEPPPANSPTMDCRLVRKDQKPNKIAKYKNSIAQQNSKSSIVCK